MFGEYFVVRGSSRYTGMTGYNPYSSKLCDVMIEVFIRWSMQAAIPNTQPEEKILVPQKAPLRFPGTDQR